MSLVSNIKFPEPTGIQCLMMPFVQGDSNSVPDIIRAQYSEIIDTTYIKKGDIGYLTIDESYVNAGKAQRAYRAKTNRALHTEAGMMPNKMYCWGDTPVWGGRPNVTLDYGTKVLLANNLDSTCALWDSEHKNTSLDGDIGHESELYPYSDAILMKAGEVHQIGILTPHESLPVIHCWVWQFFRIGLPCTV